MGGKSVCLQQNLCPLTSFREVSAELSVAYSFKAVISGSQPLLVSDGNLFASGCLERWGVPPFPGEWGSLTALSACSALFSGPEWKQGLDSQPGAAFAGEVAEAAALSCFSLPLPRALLSQQILAEPA